MNNLIPIIIILILLLIIILTCLNKSSYFSAMVDKSESNLKLNDGNTIILIFFAEWCGYCRKAKPSFEKLANDYPDKVQLIDSDKNKDLLSKYSVKSFPTIMTNTGDIYNGDRSYESLSQFVNTY